MKPMEDPDDGSAGEGAYGEPKSYDSGRPLAQLGL